ncbi:MAG: hypothetical protein R3F11_29740 [Verrucomicrobiales bacterium]
MENCRAYKVGRDQRADRLALPWNPGKGQHDHVHLIDREPGLCYLRTGCSRNCPALTIAA